MAAGEEIGHGIGWGIRTSLGNVYGQGKDVGQVARGFLESLGPGSDVQPTAELGPGAEKYLAKQKSETAAQKAKAAAAAQEAQQKAQVQAVANSPWTLAGNALAGAFTNAANQYASLTSGQALPGIDASTVANAETLAGTPSTSNAGSWLSAQSAAANAATAPVTAAMAQTQKAYTTGENAFSQALSDMGQANALAVETAPESGWLNALASHLTSTVAYTGGVPSSAQPVFKEYPLLSKAYAGAGIPVSFSNAASASGIPVGSAVPSTTGVVTPTSPLTPSTSPAPGAP